MIHFASPTFLFRGRCPEELPLIMDKLAQAGFEGIELYSMFGWGAEDIRRFCENSGLSILCDHIPYREFSENTRAVIESRKAIGAKYLTVDKIPEELLDEPARFASAMDEVRRISAACREQGIRLMYHNHGYDLHRKRGGVPMLDLILDSFHQDELLLQLDLGWIALGGGEPSHYLEKYRDRCRVIHLKDYYATRPTLMPSAFLLGDSRGGPEHNFFEFRPSGYGIMNFPALMRGVLDCRPEWITLDHDHSYERDTFVDMKMSLEYIKQLIALYQPV